MRKIAPVVIFVFFFLSSTAHAGLLDRIPLVSARIQGFVLKTWGDRGMKDDIALELNKDTPLNRQGLFSATVPNNEILVPADVTVSAGDITAGTDEMGFFSFRKSIFGLSGLSLRISFHGIKGTIDVPLVKEGCEPFFVIILRDGKVDVYRLKKKQGSKPRNPVFFVHGSRFNDFFFISEEVNLRTWQKMFNLLKEDYELSGFVFYRFNYPSEQDIVKSSFQLSSAVYRYRKIMDNKQPIMLVGYGLGGLVLRHYTVSKGYIAGSVNRMVLIGTPNHGYSFLISSDKASSKQAMSGSDFLKALNREEGAKLVGRYRIEPALQGTNGLNNSVKTFVIAGNASRGIKHYLRRFSRKTGKFMESLIERLHQLFNGDYNVTNITEQYRRFQKYIEERIDELPDGDLIVSLESAKIKGADSITIGYSHTMLIQPGDKEDVRYLALKDILLGRR